LVLFVPYQMDQNLSKNHGQVELVVQGVATPDFFYEPDSLKFSPDSGSEAKLRISSSEWLPDLIVHGAYLNRSAFTVKKIIKVDKNTWE